MGCPFLTTMKLLTMSIIIIFTFLKLYRWRMTEKGFQNSKNEERKDQNCDCTLSEKELDNLQQDEEKQIAHDCN